MDPNVGVLYVPSMYVYNPAPSLGKYCAPTVPTMSSTEHRLSSFICLRTKSPSHSSLGTHATDRGRHERKAEGPRETSATKRLS